MKEDSKIVMKNIMKNYSSQNESSSEINANEINCIVKKLFLRYSSCSSEEETWFTFMKVGKLINFFEDFGLKYA